MGRGTWSDSTTEDGRARNTKARHEECRFVDRRATDRSPRLSGIRTIPVVVSGPATRTSR
jgi:hypothetical protein